MSINYQELTIIIEGDDEGDFIAYFRDCPSISAFGSTRFQALESLEEVIELLEEEEGEAS